MIFKAISLLLPFTNVYCEHRPPDVAELSDGDSFDFIVVGSGSAGSPVAARLTERGQNVFLSEAGGEPPLNTVIPGMCTALPLTKIDWQFESQYDYRACRSLLDEVCHKARGKVLGGSSTINGMVYIRGNRVDYDEWNILSWTYDDMFPYFLRMESLTNYDDLSTELKQYHYDKGQIKISLLNASPVKWRDQFFSAHQEIGLQRNPDINGPSQVGVAVAYANVFAGERQSTAEAYLVPNSKNCHLNVAYNSLVTKILIDESNVANGVRVNIGGKREITIKAKKEIILSAGTINTPQLLMLSGIGPENELKKYGIRVYVDNTYVGQNLHDHPTTPLFLTAHTGTATSISEKLQEAQLNEWVTDRTGSLATVSMANIVAFVDTAEGSPVPDIEYMHGFISRNDTAGAKNMLTRVCQLNLGVMEEIRKLNIDSEILIILYALVRPKSRGSIHLASGDPYDHPVIIGNTLVEPDEYATYLRGIRYFEKLLTTEQFLKSGVKLARIKSLKECEFFEFQSDDYWLSYHDNVGDSALHPVGTSAIGRVVDERLRVYGVESLRVADAEEIQMLQLLLSENALQIL